MPFFPCYEKEGCTVVVPDLPGCVSEGDSLADAILMGTDAACGWLLPIIRSIICAISPAGIRMPSSTQVTIIPCIPAVAYRLL